MAYGDFKDLQSRTASFKVLGYKTFNIARHPKHDWYQRGFASIVYKKSVGLQISLLRLVVLKMNLNKMKN